MNKQKKFLVDLSDKSASLLKGLTQNKTDLEIVVLNWIETANKLDFLLKEGLAKDFKISFPISLDREILIAARVVDIHKCISQIFTHCIESLNNNSFKICKKFRVTLLKEIKEIIGCLRLNL